MGDSPEETTATNNALMASFDLEVYIGRYNATSETRLQRLLFIGKNSPDPAVSKLAYELAERQMKESGNVHQYKETFSPRADREADETRRTAHIAYDAKWVEETETLAHSHLDMLQGRLSSAQSNLNKESIRAAYLALGEFHRKRGELREALRAVLRSRDYCTSRGQTGHVCLLIIEMAIDCRDWGRVRDYVTKAEHTNIDSDVHYRSKSRVAAGLASLAEGRYWEAGQKFTSITGPLLEDFNSVVSTEDVALYGALLGLATMERTELCNMLEPPSATASADSGAGLGRMAAGLELVPAVRDALRHFSRAEYKACLLVLQQLKPQLELDIHLSPHVSVLFDQIRDKCLVEYLRPYRRIGLESMAGDFGLTTEQAQSILAGLIKSGQISNARIDCRTHTLTRESNDEAEQQRSARRKVSRLGEKVLNESYAMIIRLACLEQDLVVKGSNTRGDGRPNIYWNAQSGMDVGGFDDVYEGDQSSDDGDTPMVMDLVGGDGDMNPEDFY